MADEKDIGAGIAAMALVSRLTNLLISQGTISSADAEMFVQFALTDVERLRPPDDAAVRQARELVEATLAALRSRAQD